MTAIWLWKQYKQENNGATPSNPWEEKNYQTRILYSTKQSFKNIGKIKTFNVYKS